MRCLKWILTSLALIPGFLAAAPSWTAATVFFRSPQSTFPSGQASRPLLEKNLVRQDPAFVFQIEWQSKRAALKLDEGIIDLFCARTARVKENSILLKEPRGDAGATGLLTKDDDVVIQQIKYNWMKVSHKRKGSGWVLWTRLEAKNDDHGLYLPVVDTFLRSRPSSSSSVVTTIPRLTRLAVLSYEPSGWARVRHQSHEGYVDLQHLVGRADFSQWAWEKSKGWFLSSHRLGSFIFTQDRRKVPLSKILGFAPIENRLIVARNEGGSSIPLRTRADIKKIDMTVWGVSHLSDHGTVWWKKEEAQITTAPQSPEILTTEEFLKRPIFSYAIEEKKEIRGIASSQGVWRTLDGRTWIRIPMFGDQDLPVAIHPSGTWLVGTYRSQDRGNSFENSIRWDDLARAVEAKLNEPAKRLSLKKLDILPNADIRVQIETGKKTLSLRSKLDGTNWH